MSNDYESTVDDLDFANPSALITINKWANDNTNGKIPTVLDEIDGDAVMFIMNALYFNGDWSYQFDKSLTQERPFYPANGNSINVSTMNSEVGSKVTGGNGYKAIEMPYGRTNFTMVVIVPDETLSEFYPLFTHELWGQLTANLDGMAEFGKTIVFMPKFKFSYENFFMTMMSMEWLMHS
jgi:serpin B